MLEQWESTTPQYCFICENELSSEEQRKGIDICEKCRTEMQSKPLGELEIEER